MSQEEFDYNEELARHSNQGIVAVFRYFPKLIRLAVKSIPFDRPSGGGNECGTGACPLAVAVILSGAGSHLVDTYKPDSSQLATAMVLGGLIRPRDYPDFEKCASLFINNYSVENDWQKRIVVSI